MYPYLFNKYYFFLPIPHHLTAPQYPPPLIPEHTVRLWSFNSKMYELEARLDRLMKSQDEAIIGTKSREYGKIITKYWACIEYCTNFRNQGSRVEINQESGIMLPRT